VTPLIPLLAFAGLFGGVVWWKQQRTTKSATSQTGKVYVYFVRGATNTVQPPFYGYYATEEKPGEDNPPKRTPTARSDPKLAERDVILIINSLGGVPKKVPGGVT
jgi:hypothetical protein